MKAQFDGYLDHTERLPISECRGCGYRADSATGPRKPEPGDVSICARCRTLSVYGDDMTLRPPTDEEWAALADNPALRALTNAVAQVWPEGDK